MSKKERIDIGTVSLGVAIAGIVVPAVLMVIFMVIESITGAEMPSDLCLLVLIGLEIIALIAGVAGRSSQFGRVGLTASIVLLLLAAYFVPVSSTKSPNPGQVVEVTRTAEHE